MSDELLATITIYQTDDGIRIRVQPRGDAAFEENYPSLTAWLQATCPPRGSLKWRELRARWAKKRSTR